MFMLNAEKIGRIDLAVFQHAEKILVGNVEHEGIVLSDNVIILSFY